MFLKFIFFQNVHNYCSIEYGRLVAICSFPRAGYSCFVLRMRRLTADDCVITFIACVMMINEMESAIRKVDPSKTIEVGSFRVNPNGGQKGLQKVLFLRLFK